MNPLSGRVLGITFERFNLTTYFNFESNPFFWVDLLAIALIIWLLYRFIHRTRGERIFWGLFILSLLWLIAVGLRLQLLMLVLQILFASLIVAIPVVFQPELRAGLERIGRSTRLVTDWRKLSASEIETVVDELVSAAALLAKNKFGALIVIARLSGLREFIDTGEPVQAQVSAKLVATIFYPKSPLHDGATIITGSRIVASRVTLPLSEETDLSLGTRHRAALGIAEQTDAVAISISEETGKISLAYDSKLIRQLSADKLRKELKRLIVKKRASYLGNA